jgi:hypothetical protein
MENDTDYKYPRSIYLYWMNFQRDWFGINLRATYDNHQRLDLWYLQ